MRTAPRALACKADVRDNRLDETGTDLRALLGRAPASLRDGLAELFTAPA